ncbi:MAG: DUF992 domain-containing protein, partial [Pseudomonadota bacterium]
MKHLGMTIRAAAAALAFGAASFGAAAPAAAASGPTVKVGVLTCTQVAQTNWIVYSKREFDCVLTSATGSPIQSYVGDIRRFGANIKLNQGGQIAWAVFAPTFRENAPQQLDGLYVGAGADAALVYGAGGRVLAGGFNNSINLQPISVSSERGYGVALGLDG